MIVPSDSQLDASAIAGQPFGQCTVNAATSIVNINGIDAQRVAKPINIKMPPSSSAAIANDAIKAGAGNPRP